jgi:hypothetical protein
MSYIHAPDLQSAIYTALTGDAALTELVGDNIFDMAPEGASVPPIYVALGPEDARDASDSTGPATIHEVTVTVTGSGVGFSAIKQAAARICAVLGDAPLDLPAARVTGIRFQKALARVGDEPDQRLIDLRFRARVEDTTTV